MALKSNNTCIAVAIQSVAGTFTTPTQPADIMPVSQFRWNIQGVTIANDEYTGSPFKNADQISGKRVGFSYNIKLRPPGSGLPAANAFLIGRILQCAKMTELRTTSDIPASPEAGSSGSTNGLTLGAGATGTADLYVGMAILLKSLGTTLKDQLTAIRDYTSGKAATFVETFGSTISGNYQIPPQLGYMRDVSATDPIILSQQIWMDGIRYDMMDVRLSGLTLAIPVSTKDQAQYPELQCSFEGTIDDYADETTPSVPALGAVPFFKNGDLSVANVAVGASNLTLNMGLSTEFPPNPNKVDGVDLPELTGGTATVNAMLQKYRKATLDTLALADNQAYHPVFAQWGSSAWNIVQIVIPDARFDYGNPDLGGGIIMEGTNLLVDALSRSVCINFPGGTAIP